MANKLLTCLNCHNPLQDPMRGPDGKHRLLLYCQKCDTYIQAVFKLSEIIVLSEGKRRIFDYEKAGHRERSAKAAKPQGTDAESQEASEGQEESIQEEAGGDRSTADDAYAENFRKIRQQPCHLCHMPMSEGPICDFTVLAIATEENLTNMLYMRSHLSCVIDTLIEIEEDWLEDEENKNENMPKRRKPRPFKLIKMDNPETLKVKEIEEEKDKNP